MPQTPLSHHEIIKRAAPLTRYGLKVNLAACDRANGYIEFEETKGLDNTVSVIHALEADEKDNQLFTRVVVHTSGLASTLTTGMGDLSTAFPIVNQIPLERQLQIHSRYIAAFSYAL